MLCLPDELLEVIASNMSAKDLSRFVNVCRTTRTCCYKDHSTFKNIVDEYRQPYIMRSKLWEESKKYHSTFHDDEEDGLLCFKSGEHDYDDNNYYDSINIITGGIFTNELLRLGTNFYYRVFQGDEDTDTTFLALVPRFLYRDTIICNYIMDYEEEIRLRNLTAFLCHVNSIPRLKDLFPTFKHKTPLEFTLFLLYKRL